MKKAALYARVSTDGQEKRTIESQLFELRQQITAAGNVLVICSSRRLRREHS
jgi:DNA invertase Pin-like site-specific DNA recombinase